jgi:hypothetical protein
MRILVLGDGNFSFSLAIVQLILSDHKLPLEFFEIQKSECIDLICTSFDSYEQVCEKYPESKQILKKLNHPMNHSKLNVSVMHQVNAWELKKSFDFTFDIILWNHPHLGTENFKVHRFLMAHFFNSASTMLSDSTKNSRIYLTLVEGQDDRWNIIDEAKKSHIGLLKVKSFPENEFPGYVAKRNKNGKSFKSVHTKNHTENDMKSFTYQFTRGDDYNLCDEAKVLLSYNLQELPQSSQPETLFPCSECTKSFLSARGLKQHKHMVHELKLFGEIIGLKCPFETCKHRVFQRNEDFEQHNISKHSKIESLDYWNDALNTTTVTTNDHLGRIVIKKELVEQVGEYKYIPCHVCGQAVLNESNGYDLHLESLKPIVGLQMKCPLRTNSCEAKTFVERRALEQHYIRCKFNTLTGR